MKRIMILIWIAGSFGLESGVYAQELTEAKIPRDKEEAVEMVESRWNEIKKRLGENQRAKDPFGGKMDPGTFEEAAVIPDAPTTAAAAPAVKVVSLQDAVNKFQVNGVNPKKQMVMVGFQPVRRGEIVEIEHDNELFKLRVVKISKDEVVFMNIKNEETAKVLLGVVRLPGYQKGKSGAPASKDIFQKKTPVRIK